MFVAGVLEFERTAMFQMTIRHESAFRRLEVCVLAPNREAGLSANRGAGGRTEHTEVAVLAKSFGRRKRGSDSVS